MIYDLIVIGGGAAGIFAAIQCAEKQAGINVLVLEKSKKLLSKVKISGGGRCNVTHACFDPREMVNHYPRGHKELRGPFHRFLCGDMMGWLEDNGVPTKIEADGRVFPQSNQSQSIIDCFMDACAKHFVKIYTACSVKKLQKQADLWEITTANQVFTSKKILVATGSSNAAWKMLQTLGHSIVPPLPSLFTFNIKHPLIKDLPGLSVPQATVKIATTKYEEQGPLLITHWGLSGPAILKLSAWAARDLHAQQYDFTIAINWLGATEDIHSIKAKIELARKKQGKKNLITTPLAPLPKRLWQRMLQLLKIDRKNYASMTSSEILALSNMLCHCILPVKGKSTFKEEFVTCGGVNTKEINFKRMESKLFPNLFFAGEVLNIDAITGGFNFQAAWTGAFIAAEAITQNT